MKVFYDYAGQRFHYVQWCSPAAVGGPLLANLPNQYYNWSVFVPPAAAGKEPLALGTYLQDWRGFCLRPRWPHKGDQILIAKGPDDIGSLFFGRKDSRCLSRHRRMRKVDCGFC
jgi:hypothetical protein